MLPRQMGLRALRFASGILLPLSIAWSLATSSLAEMIVIQQWEQKSNLTANIFSDTAVPENYDRSFYGNPTDEQLAVVNSQRKLSASANAAVTGRSATGTAEQTVSNFQLNRNGSLRLGFSGSSTAQLTNTTNGPDQVSVFDYFAVQFLTDRPMLLTLTAKATVTGTPLPEKFPSNAVKFSLKSTGSASGFQDIEFYDNGDVQAPAGAMLPAGSYRLAFESDYNVGDSNNVEGGNYQAATSFNVNFGISAVPEPCSLASLLFATSCIGYRRKRIVD